MRAQLIHAVLGAAAVVLVAAGCSDSRTGTPIPDGTAPAGNGKTSGSTTPSGTTSTPRPTNRYGEPPVANPLDATRFLSQPCAALTQAQLQSFDLPAQGKPDTESPVARHAGPFCGWTNSDRFNGVDVGFLTGNKNGLADLYRARGEGKWTGYWEETRVSGYPGVFHDVTDFRPRGSCNLAVGISDTLAFRVGTDGRLKERSCDFAKQVAGAVVETLKRGG